jgi:2-dehydro-3-deoxygluconokinase
MILTRRSLDESEYGIDVVVPGKTFSSKKYSIHSIDRIGVGDSMAAGFIKAHLTQGNDQLSADWAALSGALKYGIKGDMALLKIGEMENILAGAKGIIR